MVLIYVALFFQSNGQTNTSVLPDEIRMIRAMDLLSRPLSSMPNVALLPPPPEVKGDIYLTPYWNKATVMLFENDRVVEGLQVKYDAYNDELDIHINNSVRVLSGNKVKSFVWLDSVTQQLRFFHNALQFEENGVKLVGFFEVLSDGPVPLLSLTRVTVNQPDYHMALNVGSRDVRIVKKTYYYYAMGNEVHRIGNGKVLQNAFAKHETEMKQFMKKYPVKINQPASLRAAFDYYNYYLESSK